MLHEYNFKPTNVDQKSINVDQKSTYVASLRKGYIPGCLVISKCFSTVKRSQISQNCYLQLFLVRKIYVKMVKKSKNVKISKKKKFHQFTRYDDMSEFG